MTITAPHEHIADALVMGQLKIDLFKMIALKLQAVSHNTTHLIMLIEIFYHQLPLGKPLYPGSSTINQIDRIMSTLPPPSKQDVQCIRSPYAKAILDQIIHKYPV